MRKISLIIALMGFFMTFEIADAHDGCQRKLAALENQLSYAQQYNNINRIRGLQRAISNIERYCRQGDMFDSLIAKEDDQVDRKLVILANIADAKKDLVKAEYQLEKAKRQGSDNDFLEAQYKIKEARGRISLSMKVI